MRLLNRLLGWLLFVALASRSLRRRPASSSAALPPRPTRHLAVYVRTAILLGIMGAIAGALLAASGIIPIKASSGHWAVTAWILDFAKQRSVFLHSYLIDVPPIDDEALVMKGGAHYQIACAPCHGSPARELPLIPHQMTPYPPFLPAAIAEWDPEELFYIVKHGLKFTGMPAWPAQRRDDEVWAMVAFLQRLPQMNGETYLHLATGPRPEGRDPTMVDDLLVAERIPPVVSDVCAPCHGIDGLGRGVGAFPKIAGQRPAYLNNTLHAYAAGRRNSGIMQPVTTAFDTRHIREIAEYYASLAVPASAHVESGERRQLESGAAIAANGLPNQGVPACAECHSAGTRAEYPVLAGQYEEYLTLQLRLFKENIRGGTEYGHIMRKVASGLTQEQIELVAAYYASLPWTGERVTTE